jgi:hypothetical protein
VIIQIPGNFLRQLSLQRGKRREIPRRSPVTRTLSSWHLSFHEEHDHLIQSAKGTNLIQSKARLVMHAYNHSLGG